MKPGEYFLETEPIEANVGRKTANVVVQHTGDRPVQVGSHYHFFEVNNALDFDRERGSRHAPEYPGGNFREIRAGRREGSRRWWNSRASEWCWATKARGTNEPLHSPAHLRGSLRSHHRRSRPAGRYRTDHRSREGFRRLWRRDHVRRRQGHSRRHGAERARHPRRRRARSGDHQRADHRSLGHRQGRYRDSRRTNRKGRQGRESGHDGRASIRSWWWARPPR